MTHPIVLERIRAAQANCATELNLSDLSELISEFPEELCELTELTSLTLRSCNLDFLPEAIGQLVHLQHLDLMSNQLSELPESFSQLVHLQHLDLMSNQLSELPESFSQLVHLQHLDLANNEFTKLPVNLGKLAQLQYLTLSNNQLTELPESLGELVQLESLDLSFNQLIELPETFGKLVQLQSLDLWINQLTKLPESFGQLAQLQYLDLSNNQLTDIPENFTQLVQLQNLDLGSNQLTEFSESLCNLVQLQYLFLANSQLAKLPDNFGKLEQLQHLDLASNQLTELPESFGQLEQLQYLDLAYNQLAKLPESLGQLKQLQCLDLAYNRLAGLPDGLLQLPLDSLWLQNNPELGLPDAILGKYIPRHHRNRNTQTKSPASILEAFFSSRELGGHALDEIKLVLVGRGAAGKTTVAHRLTKNRFKRETKETQGVNISRWVLPCGAHEIDVNIWDFAGQVITHSTHQFFLSESSVYLLVLTGREDSQKTDADYWLRMIRAFATDAQGKTAPVIVLLNKFELHPFKIDRNALREKYPFIAGFIDTDCKSGLGFDTLRAKLCDEIAAMPIVQHRFKLGWWRIKEALEKAQKRKNYLPYSAFAEICKKEGETNPETQRFLADIFHALGVALNFGADERLRDTTVLSPHWVTESIYKLLREAVAEETAELTMDRVAQVLPNEPEAMRLYLIELMRRFDLAFPLNERGKHWLVPQRLPEEQPDLGDEWQGLQGATRLRYAYPVIPEGLLPRFISRTYPLSEGEENEPALPRWANGVVLQDGEARALVRVDSEERRINVICKGPKGDRLSLLGVIQADFRELHAQIPELGQIEEVEAEAYPGVFVPVKALLNDEANRTPTHALTQDRTIALNHTTELNRLSEHAARLKKWRPRVFISYCSSDARLKDKLLTRLKPLRETQGLVDAWHDRCIRPGEKWDGVIREELEKADVILFLVSADFIASDYVRGVEVAKAIERNKAGEAKIIPIILEACHYGEEPYGYANVLPRKGNPVRDYHPQRNAWHEIAEELRLEFKILQDEKAALDMDIPAFLRKKPFRPYNKES